MIEYMVSEMFGPTLQGEGLHAGWPCVFLRMSSCNLWPKKDTPSKTCPWCDTPQLFNKIPMTAEAIRDRLVQMKGETDHIGLVISGGEPLLQVDDDLVEILCTIGFDWIDIETNGTVAEKFAHPLGQDIFISCSPKTPKVLVLPDWFKIIVPDKLIYVEELEKQFPHVPVYLQPCEPKEGMSSKEYKENVKRCLALSYSFGYRLSVQLHKILGIM